MTAIIDTLKDENGNTIYPQTKINAVLDNNNTDVGTLISNLQNQINNLTTPTATQTATPNTATVQIGNCYYDKIGKLVCMQLSGLVLKSGTNTHNAIVFSNIPKPIRNIIFLVPSYSNKENYTLRLRLQNDGTIQTHYTRNASFGDTGEEHDMLFTYITSD